MKSIVFAPMLACALVTLPAWAQSTPSSGSSVAIAKNPCEKPDEYPGNLASATRLKSWNKTMETYADCVKKFAGEQGAISEAATKAGNDAVLEYNTIAAKVKAAMEKEKN